MDIKKIIVPVCSIILLAAIIGVIVWSGNKGKDFSIPGQSEMEAQIKRLGYEPSGLPDALFTITDSEKFTRISARTKTGDAADINFVFFEYADANDSAKTMSDPFLEAQILKKKYKGIKYYYNEKENRAYVLYDTTLDSGYKYGGIYMDGKRLVCITTKDASKKYDVMVTLQNLGLPTP